MVSGFYMRFMGPGPMDSRVEVVVQIWAWVSHFHMEGFFLMEIDGQPVARDGYFFVADGVRNGQA